TNGVLLSAGSESFEFACRLWRSTFFSPLLLTSRPVDGHKCLFVRFGTCRARLFFNPPRNYFTLDLNNCSMSDVCAGGKQMVYTQSEKLMSPTSGEQAHRTSGIVLHSPVFYDLTVWLAMLGKERGLRERLLQL